MTSTSSLGTHLDHHPVRSQPQHRRRRARRADRADGRARRLPIEMTTPPIFRKVNPGDFPVLFISLSSPTLPLSTVDEYAETVLAQQISQLAGRRPGAGLRRAEIRRPRPGRSGRRRRAQHLARRHPQRRRQDQFQHAGRHAVRAAAQNITLRRLRRADARRPTTARSSSPAATARRSSSTRSRASSTASRTTRSRAGSTTTASIVLAIQRQPDANTVAVVDRGASRAAGLPRAGAGRDQHARC